MIPFVLALALGAPADAPKFAAVGTGDETIPGALVALGTDARVETTNGPRTVKGLVALRRAGAPVPGLPTGPHLVTAGGDRVPGEVRGGDAKRVKFRPAFADDRPPWELPHDGVAAVWFVAPPADTPTDPAKYGWLVGTPPRDALLYRNGDSARGALTAFTDTGVKFAPDGGAAREVAFKDLAAIGFNPRFARPPKPQGPHARAVLDDGTRLTITAPEVTDGALAAKTAFGVAVEIDLKRLVALDVLGGPATYLSDLKPAKAETSGFVGAGWPWAADRTVRGRPLRLLTKDGDSVFDKGLGTHPKTVLAYDLGGKYARFEALVGLDADTGKRGRAAVRVRLDGKEVDLPALKALSAGAAVPVRVDVTGAKELVLEIDFGPTGDVQADVNWGGARLVK
ncbi:MAG: hypothetical protein FJ304_20215 [Planctomycetes bacterium]|nr:hypothetical protein [Planctomycetota bacterium]